MEHVSWTAMEHGTKQDYEFLDEHYSAHSKTEMIPNLISMLQIMEGPKLGYQIDRYEHSLQSATRALRADESVDWVVAALLHDIGDSISPANHSALAASILKPYVTDEVHWVIQHHGLFQGYYYFHHMGGDRNGRDLFADNEHFDACVRFCEQYDQNCFDPDYDNLPIETFVPMLEEVLGRPSRIPGIAPLGMTSETVSFN